MMPDRLEQIDPALIELLGQRMAVLKADPQLQEPQRKDFDPAPLLAEAGVPDFVWQSLITSCRAAAATRSPSGSSQRRQVTLIGGQGRMGRFFYQQLLAAGHHVQVLERHDWAAAEQLLGSAELVLICVPIAEVLTTIRQAVPYLHPAAVLADITSIKEPIVQEMLAHHAGPVLGLHPMFGPGVPSFLSQTVIVCPGRQMAAGQWLLDLIEAQGGSLTVCTPAEHDRMMVFIQAVRHFLTFSLGVFLAEENLDLAHSLDFASPPYRLQLNLVSRLFAQDTPLYLETMIASEERRRVISRLAATYGRLAQQVTQQDHTALKQAFLKARSAFQPDTGRALAETNHLITSLSLFLAAQGAEALLTSEPSAPKPRVAVLQ